MNLFLFSFVTHLGFKIPFMHCSYWEVTVPETLLGIAIHAGTLSAIVRPSEAGSAGGGSCNKSKLRYVAHISTQLTNESGKRFG